MTTRPPDLDPTLERLASLPDDHPDAVAARRDPIRWAQVLALREFLAPARLQRAEQTQVRTRLRAAVSDALAAGAPTAAAEPPAPRTLRLARPAPWWQRAWGPVPVWAAAAAGVLLVAALGVPRLAHETVRYRGTASAAVTPVEARAVAGGIELRWHAVPGADQYIVEFRDRTLQPIVPQVTTTDTMLVLPLQGRVATLPSGTDLLWRVRAFRASTELAASRDLSLRLP